MGQLEMQAILEGHKYMNLSEQQGIDCARSTITEGCCGGWPGDVYDNISSFAYGASYPYELINGYSSCNPTSCRSKLKNIAPLEIRGYDAFRPMSATELKKQIWMYGPISIWMNAPDKLQSYTGGIVECTSVPSNGNHYVVAVGFGSDYVVIRNSWGANWGLQGDFKLSLKSNLASCQLLEDREFLQLARVSVVPAPDTSSSSSSSTKSSSSSHHRKSSSSSPSGHSDPSGPSIPSEFSISSEFSLDSEFSENGASRVLPILSFVFLAALLL